MTHHIYQDIAQRTDSNIYIGVVGPVRTGKSTFIKKFMETLVIPNIDNIYHKERAKDELPQSGSGKTIMTAEPKFIPEEAVRITLDHEVELSIRMIDCVGYMINGASGRFENGEERMVSTPWFDHEVTMTQAAETGTHKVIAEHSTIGLVITTDGSICGIEREEYIDAEARVIEELKSIGKPFIVLVNSVSPTSESAELIRTEIESKYNVSTLCVNCLELTQAQISKIIQTILIEFPVLQIGYNLPSWLSALPQNTAIATSILSTIRAASESILEIKDIYKARDLISENNFISCVNIAQIDLGTGNIGFEIDLQKELFFETLSDVSGFQIHDERNLFSLLNELRIVKNEYDLVCHALKDVRETGYGIVLPSAKDLKLQEPQIVKNGGKYSVKLKANAPAIHMIMTNIETTVTPAIGGESASEEIINFLLQGFEGDVSRIWESNIFGKSLYDIASDGVSAKIAGMSLAARGKFQETLQRVINEGAGGLICIIL